jgi:hypothetical protein
MAIHQDHEIQEFSEFLPKIRDYSGSFRLGSRADANDACSRPSSFINLPLVAVMDRQGGLVFHSEAHRTLRAFTLPGDFAVSRLAFLC